MDLQGPAIRTGVLEAPLQLERGDRVEFTMGGAAAQLPLSTAVNYEGLGGDVSVGDTILVDNGVLHFKVVSESAERVECEVLTAGELGARRSAGLTVLVDSMWGNGAGWFPTLLNGGSTRVIEIHNQRNPIFPEMSRPEPIPPNVDVGLAATVKHGADVLLVDAGDSFIGSRKRCSPSKAKTLA